MAKNLTGTLQIVTANRLRDGQVVFLTRSGEWTSDIARAAVARDEAAAQRLLAIGTVAAAESRIVEPYLTAVREDGESIVPVSLRERILPRPRIQHQHHLMRRRRIQFLHHSHDFFQLFHEVVLVVQAARRVGDQHVRLARARRLKRIEDHRCTVRARVLGDDWHAIALTPDLELFNRSGAEGVARRQHH